MARYIKRKRKTVNIDSSCIEFSVLHCIHHYFPRPRGYTGIETEKQRNLTERNREGERKNRDRETEREGGTRHCIIPIPPIPPIGSYIRQSCLDTPRSSPYTTSPTQPLPLHALFPMHYSLCTIPYALFPVHYSLHCALFPMHYSLR